MLFRFLFYCLLGIYTNSLFSQTGCENLSSVYDLKKTSQIKFFKISSEFVKTYDYRLKLTAYDSTGREKSLRNFNKDGLVTEINLYFMNVIKTQKYSYNQNNKLTEIEIQSPKGIMFEKTQFFYNDLNKLLKASHFIESGENDKVISYIKNSDECIENAVDSSGNKKNYEKWHVNYEKRIEEHLFLDTKDQIIKSETIEFNEAGNPIKRIYENKSFGQVNVSEYDYNANEQIAIELTKDKLGTLKKQQKYIYNENGLLIETQLLNSEGVPISKDVYKYEFYK
ncbi:MAG: hypothetical protein A2046_11320 [Bacteroidetes bacterium GWA2_30_7]|nr:MAG: hypothetical protein A2046_11320 [Bacteroidetes bacterium GWA2_30_7]